MDNKYTVTAISGEKILIELEKTKNLSREEALKVAYSAVMGEETS